MVAAILSLLVPVVVALVGAALKAARAPAAVAGSAAPALDALLRWLITVVTGAEAAVGASSAKAAARSRGSLVDLAARDEFNAAEENLVVTHFQRIVGDGPEYRRLGVSEEDAARLRDVPEVVVRARIRELVAQENAARDADVAAADRPAVAAEEVRSPAAGRAVLAEEVEW